MVLRAGQMLLENRSNTEIADELKVSLNTAQHYVKEFLETHSRFPSDRTQEQVNAMRQMEAMALEWWNAQLKKEAEKVIADPDMAHDRKLAALSRASMARKANNERLCLMYGIDEPMRIIEESMRLSHHKTEQTIKFSFDPGLLQPSPEPIPGLHIGGGGNGGCTLYRPEQAPAEPVVPTSETTNDDA
ncbi:MAG: hypothetical protein JO331_00705 [Verrucomicrobia bacterium]|nr:hypothetical protein [Verrucomicrobiota bacterium]